MTLPAQGNSISMGQVNTELGLTATALISLNDTAVRTLFGKASGTISLFDGFGKSNRTTASYTFTASTANASLNVSSLSGYSAGKTDITVTINSGVYLYGTTLNTPGLSLTGGTTGDTVTLINNGFIMGLGGSGTIYDRSTTNIIANATAGSTALSLCCDTTITNTSGYIGGGGGAGGIATGGGGGLAFYLAMGGGGAGGGTGGGFSSGTGAGGAGGSIGSTGGNGTSDNAYIMAGAGGGGRIVPGTGGAGAFVSGRAEGYYAIDYGRGGGAGGGGSVVLAYNPNGKPGYDNAEAGAGGGGWGASGGTGVGGSGANYNTYGGAGGSAGSTGGNGSGTIGGPTYTAGTAGGKAVALNGYTVTWTGGTSSSSRAYGAVS